MGDGRWFEALGGEGGRMLGWGGGDLWVRYLIDDGGNQWKDSRSNFAGGTF